MIIALIARMGSSRIPGKPLIDLGDGSSIKRIFESAKESRLENDLVVLTSDSINDDPICIYCEKNDINFYRGHQQYVLKRMIGVAQEMPKEKHMIYVGSDSPLVDIKMLNDIINSNLSKMAEGIDLMTCYFPNTFPGGFEINIVSTSWLKSIDIDRFHPSELEHCFNKLLLSYNRKNILNLYSELDMSWLNFSMDTKEDLYYIKRIIQFGAQNNLQSILSTIIKDDELIDLTRKRIKESTKNAFIGSLGMHSSIKSKLENHLSTGFDLLKDEKFNAGAKILNETACIINSFINNNDIKQIKIPADNKLHTKVSLLRSLVDL